MTRLKMLSSVVFVLFAYVAIFEKFAHSGYAVEITPYNLTSNLQEWEQDVAIMFYAPWCKYCKQLLPTWDSIAQFSSDNRNLVVSTFDCEKESNVEVCKYLQIDRYPTLGYVAYGNMNQSPKGGLFLSKNEMPRFVRFNADLYPEAIYEWIRFLSFVSNIQRKWSNFISLFTGQSTANSQLMKMKNKVGDLEKKVKLFGTELEKYKAIEVFNSLVYHGDPYPLLNSLEPDDQNRPLRYCVGEMAGEYCKYFREDPYCKILPECVAQEFVPKVCRPEACPFDSEQGRKVVSVCMQPSVLEEYKAALQKVQGE